MMRKLFLNKKGETLVEVLAAILIFTLSSIILYSMITSATKVNMKMQQKDETVQTQTKLAEHAETKPDTATGVLTMTVKAKKGAEPDPEKDENVGAPIPVDVFVFKDSSDDSLYAYYAK